MDDPGTSEVDPTDIALHVLEQTLGHAFSDRALLIEAVTHSSFAHEQGSTHNERLEFLGDAILQSCITIALYRQFPEAPEGELSRFRARMVNTELLAGLASELDIGPALRLGRGEESTGGHRKLRVLAGAMEAVLGALYLDGGFDICLDVVRRLMQSRLTTLGRVVASHGAAAWQDPRSALQEATQKRWKVTPDYPVVLQEGPAHDPTFHVQVVVDGRVLASASGRSKREAQRVAAASALGALADEEATPSDG